MKTTKLGLVAAALAAAFFTLPTFAQDQDPPGIAARIAFLSGAVSLEAGGAQDWGAAPLNYPMVSGDRIFTDNGARAAVQMGDSDIRLWGNTDVTLTNLTDQYKQIGLSQGSIHVRVFNLAAEETVEVDTPSGAVMIEAPGDYRINAYPDQQSALVVVNSGWVQLAGPGLNQEVDQGEAVQLSGLDNPEVGLVDMPDPDALDAWSFQRDHHIQISASARYVSTAMPGYDDLDDYGDWSPGTDYGPMWFPRALPMGWQPYTTGHWAYVAPWGYTWVDDAAWGYAPFHYGRWVMWQGRWGWVPGPPRVRPVWAPAFVAFVGGGPGFSAGVSFGGGGVAAWFPLGVAEPFVPWYHCSPAYVRTVNVTNVNITVIRNVTIVNNYNVFMNRVATVHSVNEIQVDNVTYVNREHVVAVNANVMTGGGRVQAAVVHLNVQQQQALVRAPISVARPPMPPPAHVSVGIHVNVAVAAARPVLMTPHGRVAATPTANTAHFTPASLPKPAPATAIRPATHATVPNVHPAAKPVTAGREGQPINGARPGQPANAARPGQPNNTAPVNRPGEPRQPANAARPGQPNAPANEARPGQPNMNQPHPAQQPTRSMQPARTEQPSAQAPATRPVQPARTGQPAAQPAEHPAAPANDGRPAATTPPARTAPAPARPAQPAQSVRPENAPPQQRPAPQTNRPAQPPANRPVPEAKPGQQPNRPATTTPAKNPPSKSQPQTEEQRKKKQQQEEQQKPQ